MKNIYRIVYSISLIAIATGLGISCKKSNNKNPACRIITLRSPLAGSEEFLTYKSDNKLERVISGTTASFYSYQDNTITISQFDSGVFHNKTVATLNTTGLAISTHTENDATGTSWSNTVNTYNNDEISRTVATYSTGPDSAVTTYTWVDHNLVSAISGTDTTKFDYYTDQLRQPGDFLSILQLLQGFELYRSKNLLKSYGGGVFTYEYTSDGKINSLQYYAGASVTILDFDYTCN